ncbi:MAG: phosphoribosylanthranilate isomerase [Gammaproteobacteria bacterium]
MKVLVKICGLTSREAVAAAVEAGADIAGFVFAESPRRLMPEQAVQLAEGLPDDIPRVAVMQHPSVDDAARVLRDFRPSFLQTDWQDFGIVRMSDTTRPLPVLRAGRSAPPKMPRLVLFEGPASGSGQTVDWEKAATLARQTSMVLAGGLNPDNVGDAIRQVRPYGVDVSSGVESEPGIKDPELIVRFVQAVREAQTTLDIKGEAQ